MDTSTEPSPSEPRQSSDSLPLSPAAKKPAGQRFWQHPATRIVLFYLVFVGIVSTPLKVYAVFQRLGHDPLRHHPDVAALLGEALLAGGALLTFWIMVRFVDRRPWATAGFTRRDLLPQTALGFGLGVLLLSVSVGVLWALGIYHVTGYGTVSFLLLPLVLYLGVSILEETMFRGYLFQTLEARWGSGVALVSTALWFGLIHLVNPMHGVTPLEHLAGPAFICLEAGMMQGAAYLLTRRWWLPIGIHWAWDFWEGPVFGLHDSGTTDPHTLLHSQVSGSFLATGGPFGPEASLTMLIMGTLLGIVLLCAAIRRGQWQPRPQRTAEQRG